MDHHTYAMTLIPIAAIILAQSVKFVRYSTMHGLDWSYLLTPGHMPSAHSAFVSALVVCVGYYQGMGDGAFAVAVGFATITIYDALRVRMQIGEQGRVLNILIKEIPGINRNKFPHLKERVGHYGSEVLGGIAFGAAVAAVIIWILG